MTGSGYDTKVVYNGLAKDAQITKCVQLHIVRFDPSNFSYPWSYLFVPIGKNEYDDRPTNLLFVEAAFPVHIDELVCSNNAVVNDVGAGRVFNARPHYNRLTILDSAAGRAIDHRNLALHSDNVTLEARQTVAVDTDLSVHEVDEAPKNVQFG